MSTSSLTFVAEDLLQTPRTQSVTGTVNTTTTGTLYVLVETTGAAVHTVGAFSQVTTTSASGIVFPENPNMLGVGTHTSTIRVRACMNSSTCATGELSGSPRTVNVTYTVNPPAPRRDAVFPRIAIANVAGDVVIRGTNLSGVSSVSFGGQPALSFTVISGTELRARHPPLAAGSQAISLNNGAIAFGANLAVTEPQTYSATMLTYPGPAPVPWITPRPTYDAERKAIFQVLPANAGGPQNPPGPARLLKYSHGAGGWSQAQVVTITGLRNVVPGPTGSSLLGYTDDAVLEIHPDSLTVTATYALPQDSLRRPDGFWFITGLPLTNDGYAVVTFGCGCGSAGAPIYFLDLQNHGFRMVNTGVFSGTTIDVSGAHPARAYASANGARVLLGPYQYQPSTGAFDNHRISFTLRDNNVRPPIEMDRAATRSVLAGTIDPAEYASPKHVDVYDGNFRLMGRIHEPMYSPVQNMHAAVSPDGNRVYVLHFDFNLQAVIALSTYDISSDPTAAGFPLVGSRTPLPPMEHVNFDSGITLTPDARTLLIAADNGLFVQPVP